MCVIVANIMERCSLFLPPRGGAEPMALMLWLDLVLIMMMMMMMMTLP
jgi:hypothetical protein